MENKNIKINEEIVEVEFEEKTQVEQEETRKDKAVNWVKRNGKKVAVGAAGLALAGLGYLAGLKKRRTMDEADFIFDNNDERIAMMEANSEEINEEMI